MTDASKSEHIENMSEALARAIRGELNQHNDDNEPVLLLVRKVVSDLATLTRQRDGLVRIVETCLCPDPHCNNIGTTWHMEQHGPGDVEQVPEPCAWCDLRAKAIAAAKGDK